MYKQPARVQRLEIPAGRRILAVSDIHGNLPYLRGLLERAAFGADDELIVVGDFLEKGPESLNTLRYLMALSKQGNCHLLLGNCDSWNDIFLFPEEADEQVLHYIVTKKVGLLWEMCNAAGVDPFEIESFTAVKQLLRLRFPAEWAFLEKLPHAIETEHYIFAHAAVDPDKPLRAHSAEELTRCDAFLRQGRRFDRWVIVGHWPVMLYHRDIVCANPIIDRDRRIISIDGGCVLKDDGQLNALVIPYEGSEDFSWVAYDPFPLRTVKTAQAAGERSYYIRWGDSRVQVLRRGEEFSHCRHVRTGYEMDILTKYLFTGETFTDCNDCTDYVLPLEPGDAVSVVEETSRGYFVKHKGVSGWYYGELI
ncbi:MAG: metallophosphoesterase [Oscillospiraceae bacterium]|nr:metallophosphoesterase [Oscillospiraceae bacterium]